MTMTRRPRVAAIGLDDAQVASIEPLCGDLRPAESVSEYLQRYNWTETDAVVMSNPYRAFVDSSVNVMVIGPAIFNWTDPYDESIVSSRQYAVTNARNTERELAVSPDCPDLYRSLAADLSKQLAQATESPAVVETSRQCKTALIETTSGHPVALRLILPALSSAVDGEVSRPIALLLPEIPNLAAWFRAFLCDVHESDPARVPAAPPRLSQPSDWYTPQERVLADRITEIESEVEHLSNEQDQLQADLNNEGEKADSGIRRVLWIDGDNLTAAVSDLLTDLGFEVRDMDSELRPSEPKREDLRLTLQSDPGWEAIVEVKGYSSGTRTNDSRQISGHRERYIREEGRPPDLTVWLANPYRTSDPSSRPAPDRNVHEIAEAIGAVHVQVSDLYRQWALAAAGSLDAETVVQSLVNAAPGLWSPLVPSSNI